jgi:hypothetical protein
MLKLRSLVIAVGLTIIGSVSTNANAATPAELKEEARRLNEEARALEARADAQREQAKQIFIAEFKKADGLDDQADPKKVQALQKYLQASAFKEARAMSLREQARALLISSFNFGLRAAIADEQASNERQRAKQQREAAKALLAGNPDAETKQVAAELNKQADEDDRDGKEYESQAKDLRGRQDSTKKRADALVQRAAQLETAKK